MNHQIENLPAALRTSRSENGGGSGLSDGGITGMLGNDPLRNPDTLFGEIVPLKSSEAELPEFPIHALPKDAFYYCKAVAENTQTDPAMAAMFCLTSMALANQNKYMVEVKPGWTEPLNLYSVICAPPSERKSPVQRRFTEAIDEYEFAYNEHLKPRILECKNALKNLDRQISIMKKELSSAWDPGLSAEINELEQERDEMKQIHERQFYGDNITPESLQRDLYENEGVFSIISTEGGLFDNIGGKYSGKADYDILLKAFNGERARLSRIGRGKQDLPNPYLTIMISCQPTVLGEVMQDKGMRGKGLLARFNYVFPVSYVGSRTFETEPVPEQLEDNYKGFILKMLYAPEPEIPQILTFSPEARKILSDYFAENERYMKDWETALRAVTIGECLKEHAKYAFEQICGDEDLSNAETLLRKLKALKKPSLKRQELFRAVHCSRLPKVGSLEAPLAILENCNYIIQARPDSAGKVGRPRDIRIFVNPALFSEEPA